MLLQSITTEDDLNELINIEVHYKRYNNNKKKKNE